MQTIQDYRYEAIINRKEAFDYIHTEFRSGTMHAYIKAVNEACCGIDVPTALRDACSLNGSTNRRMPVLVRITQMLEEDYYYADEYQHVTSYWFDQIMNDRAVYKSIQKKFNSGSILDLDQYINKYIYSSRSVPPDYIKKDWTNARRVHLLVALLQRFNEIAEYEYNHKSNAEEILQLTAEGNPAEVSTPPTEDSTMETNTQPAVVEKRTYINDNSVASLTNEQIFAQIAAMEYQARVLATIDTPSKAIAKRIKALRKSAVKLAKIVDDR